LKPASFLLKPDLFYLKPGSFHLKLEYFHSKPDVILINLIPHSKPDFILVVHNPSFKSPIIAPPAIVTQHNCNKLSPVYLRFWMIYSQYMVHNFTHNPRYIVAALLKWLSKLMLTSLECMKWQAASYRQSWETSSLMVFKRPQTCVTCPFSLCSSGDRNLNTGFLIVPSGEFCLRFCHHLCCSLFTIPLIAICLSDSIWITPKVVVDNLNIIISSFIQGFNPVPNLLQVEAACNLCSPLIKQSVRLFLLCEVLC
jgi:hypothetical protein